MEFISADEFLKQDKYIQKVFEKWWTDNLQQSDLVKLKLARNKEKIQIIANIDLACIEEGEIIPLFTEGQLRKFIEDKSKCKNIEISGDIETGQYYADFYEEIYSGIEIDTIENLGTDKFKAYWTLALIFAKECIKECL
jgi:hypothetical protein